MTDDLVKRLRFGSLTLMGSSKMNLEAADRIEALQAEAHAAAVEAAAECVERKNTNSVGMVHPVSESDANAIRALHTDASLAAIERIKREAKNEALREAAAACQTAWAEMQEANPTRHDALPYIQDGCEACQDAITALIEKDKDDD